MPIVVSEFGTPGFLPQRFTFHVSRFTFHAALDLFHPFYLTDFF
jgi:hypothetical protein